MSKQYRAKARSFEPDNISSIHKLIQDVYFETYIDLGQTPDLIVLPPDIFKLAEGWDLFCLLPHRTPVLAKAKPEITQIGMLLSDDTEITVQLYSKHQDILSGNIEPHPQPSLQTREDILQNLLDELKKDQAIEL